MKLYKILFLLLLSITITNCSKDNDVVNKINKSANLKGSGDSANDLLANHQHTKLLIQIAYVVGFKPEPQAIDDFVEFIKKRTFKEDVEIQYMELQSPGEESLALEKIADLEKQNRTAYNEGETLAIYIYFADAPAKKEDDEDKAKDEDLVTLGAVYRNTSMVIYESTIRELTKRSLFIGNATVETATLNHEFCHLLGLVNLGTPTLKDHEDDDHTNHCNVSGCLMQSQLQFGQGMMKMLAAKNNAVPVLDPECLADLKSNGGR